MRARTFVIAVCTTALAATVVAQPPGGTPAAPRAPQAPRPGAAASREEPPPPPPAPAPAAAARPRREGQPVNIRIEFTLSDQRGNGAPVKRTISMIVADGHTGMIRSQSTFKSNDMPMNFDQVPLNIDAAPELLGDGKIRVGFNIQYDWPQTFDTALDKLPRGSVVKTALHDSVSLILESGKPMVAAQSADPLGDRQVSVEVKATVLR